MRRTSDTATTLHLFWVPCRDAVCTVEDGDTLASPLATVSYHLTDQHS